MNTHKQKLIVRSADQLVERALENARASGRLDRRDFLRASVVSLSGALLTACNSEGPKWADRWLKTAEKKNEQVERFLFRHTSMNHGSPGAKIAGNKFPAYFISKTAPVWDEAARGPWTLEVGGAVRSPLRLSLAELTGLKRQRQRVDHFCVEGWTAVEVLTGVSMQELARMVQPTPDAQYVDFAGFDQDYHESWDIDSALHPQTIIAYAKEDTMLPASYGAPARVHSPVKLGYKNTKYLTRIIFMPMRNGGYWTDKGYEWYGGT